MKAKFNYRYLSSFPNEFCGYDVVVVVHGRRFVGLWRWWMKMREEEELWKTEGKMGVIL